ncbi:hypothetical protein AVEN_17362-1 [Araneus ventricosus]|uniref:Uncharacterized protein n=1 Tax=Araneus ventricosus TaxID=182803 RepID=A0A4Y2BKS2_ARAVE|nr:hypothetical protein AVEN_17362-1 [Araneus ventricosus]
MTTHPTAFSPIAEHQPAEIRPTIMEVAWSVTAGLGVSMLNEPNSNSIPNERSSCLFDEFMVRHDNTISGSKKREKYLLSYHSGHSRLSMPFGASHTKTRRQCKYPFRIGLVSKSLEIQCHSVSIWHILS